MNPEQFVRDIYRDAIELPEPYSSLSDNQKETANELLSRFDAAEQEWGELPHHDILRPMLLSKNGKYEEALAFTEQRYQESPNWETAVAAANAARRAGDLETAAAMFARGAEHEQRRPHAQAQREEALPHGGQDRFPRQLFRLRVQHESQPGTRTWLVQGKNHQSQQ